MAEEARSGGRHSPEAALQAGQLRLEESSSRQQVSDAQSMVDAEAASGGELMRTLLRQASIFQPLLHLQRLAKCLQVPIQTGMLVVSLSASGPCFMHNLSQISGRYTVYRTERRRLLAAPRCRHQPLPTLAMEQFTPAKNSAQLQCSSMAAATQLETMRRTLCCATMEMLRLVPSPQFAISFSPSSPILLCQLVALRPFV